MKLINELTGAELFEVNAERFEDITSGVLQEGMAAAGAVYNAKIGCVTVNGKNHLIGNVAVAERMSYREFKLHYSAYMTQKGSYNSADKTIVVYRTIIKKEI